MERGRLGERRSFTSESGRAQARVEQRRQRPAAAASGWASGAVACAVACLELRVGEEGALVHALEGWHVVDCLDRTQLGRSHLRLEPRNVALRRRRLGQRGGGDQPAMLGAEHVELRLALRVRALERVQLPAQGGIALLLPHAPRCACAAARRRAAESADALGLQPVQVVDDDLERRQLRLLLLLEVRVHRPKNARSRRQRQQAATTAAAN